MRSTLGVVGIAIGAAIYVLWRSEDLAVFTWIKTVGLMDPVAAIRNSIKPVSEKIPGWFMFSFPHSLWAIAGILFLSAVWKTGSIERHLWVSGFIIIAVGSEIGQAVHLVPGTYDHTDMAMLVAAVLSGLAVNDILLIREAINEKH